MPKPHQPSPPEQAERLFQHGLAALSSGDLPNAGAAFEAVIRHLPRLAAAHHMLGIVLQSQGRLADADAAISRAIDLDRRQPDFFANRALVRIGQRQFYPAIADARAAIALRANHRGALVNLAFAQMGAEQYADAATGLRGLLEAYPDFVPGYINLAVALNSLGSPEEARVVLARALERSPDNVDLLRGLGDTLVKLGHVREALASYKRGLTLQPDNVPIWSAYLSLLNYLDDATPEGRAEAAFQFGALVEAAVPAVPQTSLPPPRPDRNLRIGFVSGDMRDHSVSLFLVDVLPCLAELGDTLYAYSSHPSADATTNRLRPNFTAWRDIAHLNDNGAAALVRGDKIDILIDLSGHSSAHRLVLFAQRPAPVAMTWLGYPATTGLRRIDYVIADWHALPADIEALFSEQPLRLPDSYLCFSPPPFEPPQYSADAPVTFGSFNIAMKMGDSCMATWARILHRVPGSQLLLKDWRITSGSARQAILDHFASLGIPSGRVTMLAPTATREEHLRLYGRMTMALDPFPYAGTTTTMEALTAGVPVLTLDTGGFETRVGASLLKTAGLGQWIATDTEDYVERAVRLVSEARKPELRRRVREQVLASPLCDAPRFAAGLHEALHRAWRGEASGL